MQFATFPLATLLYSAASLAVPLTAGAIVEPSFDITNYYTGCVAYPGGNCEFTTYDLTISSSNGPPPYFSVHCTGRDTENDKVVNFNCSETSSSKIILSGKPSGNTQALYAGVGWEDHGHLRVATGNGTAPIYPLGPKNFSIPITFITPAQ